MIFLGNKLGQNRILGVCSVSLNFDKFVYGSWDSFNFMKFYEILIIFVEFARGVRGLPEG